MSAELLEALAHPSFPEVDLALRRGAHIHEAAFERYAFVHEHRAALTEFYDRYGCDLTYSTHGFYYLIPHGERLASRPLKRAEMLVGIGLCLAWLEPGVRTGRVTLTETALLERLGNLMGRQRLTAILQRSRRRGNVIAEADKNRRRLRGALRNLEELGFVERMAGEELRTSPALMRFAELVHGRDDVASALARLIDTGRATRDDPEDDDTEAEP